ncbi:MAG TPA: hypothetical protein QF851_01180 [Flavobacteriales bacterium]|nr:hypothetical protein [Flavobacteriales bacterium]
MRLGLKILVLCIIAYSLFSYQRTTAQNKKESTNYPNKDSELAILMRDLVENTEKVKKQIINGEEIEFFIEFKKLHTAVPTEVNLRDDGLYTAFTESYIYSVKELINTKNDKATLYNNMIQSCINCHQQICPGPVKRIRKLKIKK